MNLPWMLVGLLGIPLAAGAWYYNRLVAVRNRVREAWSGIDVQLKRRANLVPNLVSTVEAYAAHERRVLDELTRLGGKSASPAGGEAAADAGNDLARALKSFLSRAEHDPGLRADANFRRLQEDLAGIEDELQLARRYYNGAVRDFNTRVESFPGNLLAEFFGFAPEPFFEIARATEREAPAVNLARPGA